MLPTEITCYNNWRIGYWHWRHLIAHPKELVSPIKKTKSAPFPGCTSSYLGYSFGSFFLQKTNKDCYCLLEGGTFFQIFGSAINVVEDEEKRILIGRRFNNIEDYFINPIASSRVGIVVASNLEDSLEWFSIAIAVGKLVGFPLGNSQTLLIQILHTLR